MVLGDKTKCSRIQVTKDSEFLLVLGCVHCIGQWFSGQAVELAAETLPQTEPEDRADQSI